MGFLLRLLFVIITFPVIFIISLIAGLFLMIITIWDLLEED